MVLVISKNGGRHGSSFLLPEVDIDGKQPGIYMGIAIEGTNKEAPQRELVKLRC
jgi:hypothetical protein